MGRKWRRFSEGVRQKFGEYSHATSNERNRQMLREAEGFARHLRKVGEQLAQVDNSMRGLGFGMKALLESPIPRPYIISETGETMRESPEHEIVGAGVQIERITTASEVLGMRLNTEVHAPLREWLVAYDKAKILLDEVEQMRFELDSRRRTVAGLESKANAIRSKLDRGDGNQHRSFEAVEKKLRHKEEKYANFQAEYEQQEQICSNAFRSLLKDSVNLRDFLAQSYKVLHEISQEAYGGFSYQAPTPAPAGYPGEAGYPGQAGYPSQPYRPPHQNLDAPGSPPPAAGVLGY